MRLTGATTTILSCALSLVVGPLSAQTPKPLTVSACPAADSLIGAQHIRRHGRVFVTPDSAHGRTIYSTGTRFLDPGDFHVTALAAQDQQQPAPLAGGELWLYLVTSGRAGQVDSFSPPALAVILNDSLTLHFGAVLVHPYHGPPQPFSPGVNVSISMPPSTFLAIVRSPAPVFEFLGSRRKASRRELDDVQAVFRGASCNLAPP
jgi:hypothetical protein